VIEVSTESGSDRVSTVFHSKTGWRDRTRSLPLSVLTSCRRVAITC